MSTVTLSPTCLTEKGRRSSFDADGAQTQSCPPPEPPVVRKGTSGKSINVSANYLKLSVEDGKGITTNYMYTIWSMMYIRWVEQYNKLLFDPRRFPI